MRDLLILLLLLSSPLLGEELFLKQKFGESEPGSYLVIEQNKNFTFLYVRERNTQFVTIEEISIPAARFANYRMRWKTWFESGAPGQTSWTISQIDLREGEIVRTYSFTRRGWIDLSKDNPFIATLFNLRFQPVPQGQRKKIGLPPGYGKQDNRSLWNPRLIFEGNLIPNVHFNVWKARWPADGSELSKKWIEVYFPEKNPASPDYPTYFPYWIEVEGKIGSAKLRVVDSGNCAFAQSQLPSCFLQTTEHRN